MKTYKQFQENVAALTLRKGSRFLLPALATGIGAAGTLYQATKGNGESNFENLRKQQQAGKGEKLRKKVESDAKKPSTSEKIKNALVDATLDYKKGLSVKPQEVKGKKYRTDEMKGKSPADYVRELLRRQNNNMIDKRAKNKEIDDK